MKTVPLSADRWAPARAALCSADPRTADLIAADPTRATAVGGCDESDRGTARGLAGRAAADAGGAARNRQRRAAMDRPFPRESRVPPRSRGAPLRRPARLGPATESRRRNARTEL